MPALRVPDAPWLAEGSAKALLDVLDRDGEEARVIGGAVRNLLLGEAVGDIDIATTATPEDVSRRAVAAGFKAVPTGIEHGTVTIVADGTPYEVTTLREDIETFGRKATVRFGRDWEKDARRRDFTINALSMTRHGDVADSVGGLADLEARRVRFIGDATTRIREDYLRILRFFRFHARYGNGAPDAAGVAAAIAEREGLRTLSRERIRAELLKLVAAPAAPATIAILAETGLLLPILGVTIPPQLDRLAAIAHALGLAADPVRALGVLALHTADDAHRLAERLRLSNDEHQRLATMVEDWRGLARDHGEAAARALLYRLGPQAFADRVVFAWTRARAAADDTGWKQALELPQRWQPPRFPLRAADLIARGLAKGPALGEALRAAEDAWVAGGFTDDPAALEAIADRHGATRQ